MASDWLTGSRDLRDRVAMVTGAGVGIGRAAALALAGAGAAVGIHYHTSAAGAQSLLDDIRAAGGDGLLLPGDLTREDHADDVVDRLTAQFGRLDVLFNNAGAPLTRARIE